MQPEYGVCIDCGERSQLRLPRRFPHICADCLFVVDRENERRDEVGRLLPRKSLVSQLHERVLTIGSMAPGERRMDG